MTDNFKNKNRGFVMLVVVVVFLFITLGSAFSLASIIYRQSSMVRNSERSLQSMYAAESLQEDILYRLITDKKVSELESFTINGSTAEATIENSGENKIVTSIGEHTRRIRKSEMIIESGNRVGFDNGVLAGEGGVKVSGSGAIEGDIYSNGPVIGSGGVNIKGDVVSAGPNGLIKYANKYTRFVDGSVYANRIETTWASGDAYYSSIDGDNSRIDGVKHPNSKDKPLLDPIISDEMIESWKQSAESGGTYSSCPYNLKGAWQGVNEIGNIRINCDLNVSSDAKVKITGPVWVNGNINISGGSTVEVDPSLGGIAMPIIADKITDKMNGGKINVSGGANLKTSDENAFLLLISQNESAEKGGNQTAINASGGSTGGNIIFYSNHGKVNVSGGSQVPVVAVGYEMDVGGGAKIRYVSNAADLVMPDTPSEGGYKLKSLREIQ